MGFRLPKSKARIRREAALWIARLRSGRDPHVELKFERWHDSDSRHAAAFERVRRTYEQAGLLRHSALAGERQPQPAIARSEWSPRPALAAALALLIVVPAGLLVFTSGPLSFAGTKSLMLMTSVNQIKQVELADGSRVTLDGSTKLEIELERSRRTAHLRYGRARFQIARAAEPFIIQAADSTVMASGGVIDIERSARQSRVQVIAGAADVSRSGESGSSLLALGPGESATVNSGGTEQKEVGAPASDWTRAMIQFDRTPLAEAVALANQHSKRHILLVGDVDALRVTGAFRAGDSVGLAKALAAAFGLSLDERADGTLILSRHSAPAPTNKKGG